MVVVSKYGRHKYQLTKPAKDSLTNHVCDNYGNNRLLINRLLILFLGLRVISTTDLYCVHRLVCKKNFYVQLQRVLLWRVCSRSVVPNLCLQRHSVSLHTFWCLFAIYQFSRVMCYGEYQLCITSIDPLRRHKQSATLNRVMCELWHSTG